MRRPPSLAAVGPVVFAANAGLLILQLVAGRILAPFVGSSLETWAAVIASFLGGIAWGNAVGAGQRFASPSGRTLAAGLLAAAAGAGWLVALPDVLHRTGWHTALSLAPRIVILSVLTCVPVAFALSVLTPVAVRLATSDVAHTGRVAGMTFALGTLGCLFGNYATGFWLVPSFTLNALVGVVAVGFVVLAVPAFLIPSVLVAPPTSRSARPSLLTPSVVVFACGFAGMALELAGVRVMAQLVGVSLFTWTGCIGVMLAGTAVGNVIGGTLGDRARRRGPESARSVLGLCLIAAGGATATILGLFVISGGDWFKSWSAPAAVVAWSFTLFFAPMTLLGTVTPQVIRLATTDIATAGAVAGRLYAVSTLGALAGTLATGFFLLAELGLFRCLLFAALIPVAVSFLVARVWQHKALLYLTSVIGGVSFGGLLIYSPSQTEIAAETNYYTIQVKRSPDPAQAARGVNVLQLDLLIHSRVDPNDPTYLHYTHEQIQLDVLREQSLRVAAPRVLVIGGGAYTFPRAARTLLPTCQMDVVEIDPVVTAVTYDRLFLDPSLGIRSFHRDGRQFVAEDVRPGSYDLITMDAVNDLSVPGHLLTKEFHDRVRMALAPNGVYLVSIIDRPDVGRILPAVVHTLRASFAHVVLLTPDETWDPRKRTVFAIYAADVPYDEPAVFAAAGRLVRDPRVAWGGGPAAVASRWVYSHRPPKDDVGRLLSARPPLVLTDQYAPVDWLMSDVFRNREQTP